MSNLELLEALRVLLKNNIVTFTYKKRDGSIRKARGTRNLGIASAALGYDIPAPKNAEQPNSYYDLDVDGWRSFVPELLLEVSGVEPLPEDYAKSLPRKAEPVSRSGGFGISPVGLKEIPVVGIPVVEPEGFAIPLAGIKDGDMTIDDFARLIAKYAVDEFFSRMRK